MLPSRIKNISFATASPHSCPVGLVVVPFLDLPDPAQIQRTLLRLRLGRGRFRESGIAASRQSGEQNKRKRRKSPRNPNDRLNRSVLARLPNCRAPRRSTVSSRIRIIKNKQSNTGCHYFCRQATRTEATASLGPFRSGFFGERRHPIAELNEPNPICGSSPGSADGFGWDRRSEYTLRNTSGPSITS